LLRDRETQVSTEDGGRVIADTVYNTVGSKVKTSAAYYNSGAPSNTLVVAPDNQVPSQTGYVYDGAGRETAVISYALSHEKWRTSYVYGGNFTTVIPPTGGTATSTFEDARENTTDIYQYHAGVPIDPINDPAADYDHIRYGYTPDGQPSSVKDAAGNVWTRSYNLLGQTVSESDPDTGTSTSTYDDQGQVLSETDARGKTTSYQYDVDGRKTASYDITGGAAPSTTNQIGGWTFDTLKVGMPTSSTVYVAGSAYTEATIGYNAFAKPTGTRVTLPGSEGALAPTNGYATAFTYDSVGNLATQTDQAAGGLPQETITYGRDSADRPTSVRGIWDYLDNTAYTEFDEVQQYAMGPSTRQVWQTLDYDEQTRALRESVVGDSTTASVDDLSYTYDASGNVTSTQDRSPAAGTDTQCFRYDYADRLSAAWTGTDGCTATPAPGHATTVGGPMPYWQSWTFTIAGDRLTQTDHDTSGTVANDTTTTYHYPAAGSGAHRLASTTATGPAAAADSISLGYDASGNTTSIAGGPGGNQTLSWNDQGKVATDTTSAGVTKYIYDPDGNLLLRKDPGRTTLYLDDEELVLAGSTVTGTRYYSAGDVKVAARTGTSTVTYLASDRQNTDTVSLDSATLAVDRRRYTPYGQTRTAPTTWPGDVGYVGGTADPTTMLENLGAREYDPALGRFLSSDPILESADPKEMGGYAYAGNNPVTHADPSGDMLYDDSTGMAFGNGKLLSNYYHKHKKAVRKIIASRNRSWNIFYHSAYYRWIGSPAYQRAYTKYLRAQYDAISRANYPPKPKPKPHKSFWGKIGHAAKKYAPAALSVVSVVATVAAFTPVCAGVCLGIAAAADAAKGGLEWSEGNTSGAAWDFAAVATYGAGRYLGVAEKASKLRYFGELGNSNAVRMGLRNKFGAQGAARMMRQSASAFTHYKSLRQAHDLVDGTFTAYNMAINGSVAFNDFYLEGHGGGEGGE
jgi:RHS repeat-associated protein